MPTSRILLAALALSALAACSRQPGNFTSATQLRGCSTDEQCEASELCVFRLCAPRCGAGRSCDHGAACFDVPSGPACVDREYNACVDSKDCPVATTCRNGRCASDCNPDAGDACGDCQNGLCLPRTSSDAGDASTPDAGSSSGCKPGVSQCQNGMVMQCDDAGRLQPKEACPFACKDGACIGVCKPGMFRCDQLDRQRCDDAGTWKSAEMCRMMCTPDACETACVNGTRLCNDDTLMVCRGGRMVAIDTCDYVCRAGACAGSCTPGAQQCRGNGVITCDADAAWSAPVECPAACSEGKCGGECRPGSARCTSGTAFQTCDRRGQWTTNTNECRGRACVDGACTGVCTPGATRCEDGVTLATCGPDGQWGSVTPCPTQACEEGVCVERCAPQNLRCSPSDPTQPQVCDAQGHWQNAPRCMPMQTCVEGACRGECAPGARRCNPDNSRDFQVCGPGGEWQPPMPCGADQRCAGAGVCGLGNMCPAGQSPTWWGEGDDVDRTATDPRWGDTFETFASSGQAMPAGYAIVFDRQANQLSVTLRTRADDTPNELDFAYFGIVGTAGGMPIPRAVRIALGTSAGSDDPRSLPQITSYEFAMGAWMSTNAQPPWLEHPAAWVASFDPGWVVSFRVDLTAAGVDITAPFRVAFGLHAENEFGSLDWTTPAALSLSDLAASQPRTWPELDVRSVMCASRVDVP